MTHIRHTFSMHRNFPRQIVFVINTSTPRCRHTILQILFISRYDIKGGCKAWFLAWDSRSSTSAQSDGKIGKWIRLTPSKKRFRNTSSSCVRSYHFWHGGCEANRKLYHSKHHITRFRGGFFLKVCLTKVWGNNTQFLRDTLRNVLVTRDSFGWQSCSWHTYLTHRRYA